METLNTYEKIESLKETIYQLYSKEGRSKVYISKLLNVNRKKLSEKINEWNFPEAEPMRHMTPSKVKFLNKNRNRIKSRLDNDYTMTDIAEELGIGRKSLLDTYIKNDSMLLDAYKKNKFRLAEKARMRIENIKDSSYLDYDIIDNEDEEWKDIPGYEGYMISNYGRVKHYSVRYKSYHLVKSHPNKNNGRLYVSIEVDRKRKNFQVSRLVGFAFVPGYSEERNTINHRDGDVTNNYYRNLKWDSQSENNLHSYRELNRSKVTKRTYNFKKILYKDTYEFKTVTAFANFLGKSETQTRRYLDNPEKHDIKLII